MKPQSTNSQASRPQVSVSGSYSKHWDEVVTAVAELSASGATVLSPRHDSQPVKDVDGFIVFAHDDGTPDEIELRHLRAIAESDFLYLVDPDGYVGPSAALELGFALASGIPVYASDRPAKPPFDALLPVASPASAVDAVATSHRARAATMAISRLSAYVARASQERGFTDETPADVLILLVEEVGEVAHALRLKLGLPTSDPDERSELGFELVDCLIYILHMAKQAGVDLADAFAMVAARNDQRKWSSSRRNL